MYTRSSYVAAAGVHALGERLTGVLLCGCSTEQYTSKTQADIGSRYILNTNAIGVIHLSSVGEMQLVNLSSGS